MSAPDYADVQADDLTIQAVHADRAPSNTDRVVALLADWAAQIRRGESPAATPGEVA